MLMQNMESDVWAPKMWQYAILL